MRSIHVVLAAVAVTLAGLFPAQASSLRDITQGTFKLHDGGNGGHCSAEFIGNDKNGALFLTAAHCVTGTKALNVREQKLDPKNLRDVLSETIYYAKAVRTFASKDVAILQLVDKDVKISAPAIDIATVEEANTLVIGDEVLTVGYPAAQELSVIKGEFTGKRSQVFQGLDRDTVIYQTTVRMAGGNSGGGLYAKFGDQYKLIGTATGIRMDNPGVMTFFQTSETINEIVKGWTVPYTKADVLKSKLVEAGRLDDK